MSMSLGTFSMNTGQARSHQPQVVQAQTVSAFRALPMIDGSSVLAPGAWWMCATCSWCAQIQCLRSWFTPLWVSGLPVMYVGQWVWQRPHSVQLYRSSPFFQVRSRTVFVPNCSASRFGVGSALLPFRPWKKTFGSAVMTWKCFPRGRKFRNVRMMVRCTQNMASPSAETNPFGSGERTSATADVNGSQRVKPCCSSTRREAPKVYSLTIRPAMNPRMRYASQERVSRSGFTSFRSQKK